MKELAGTPSLAVPVPGTDAGGLSLAFSIPEGFSFRYFAETNRIVPTGTFPAGEVPVASARGGTLSGGIRNWRERSPLFPDGMVKNLTLEMTQQCNMRCAYCLYSGNYDNRRRHGDVAMDSATIAAAIRLYVSLNRNRPAAHVSFYGGEALLEFGKIRDAVDLARTLAVPRPLTFGISTNGLLLDDEVGSWLDDNPDVSVLVTLNGPFQDDFRRDRSGGKTLAPILRNLGRLKSGHPDVWASRVRFVCNVASLDQILPMRDFFAAEIGKVPIAITNIVPYHGNDFINSLVRHDRENRESVWRDLAEEYLETGDPFLHVLFRIRLSNVLERPIIAPGTPGETQTCHPLEDSLFVSADGTLSLCERCGCLSVGTVGQGVDESVLSTVFDDAFRAFRAKCGSCWAQRLCSVCVANVDGIGTDNPNVSDAFCRNEKANVLEDLRLFCRMALFHPDAMSKLFPDSIHSTNAKEVCHP